MTALTEKVCGIDHGQRAVELLSEMYPEAVTTYTPDPPPGQPRGAHRGANLGVLRSEVPEPMVEWALSITDSLGG